MTRLRQLLTHIMSNTEQNKLQFYGFTAARSARALKKEDSAMNEKIYNTMRTAGTAGIVVGIVTIATGLCSVWGDFACDKPQNAEFSAHLPAEYGVQPDGRDYPADF